MKIALGCDHAGVTKKKAILRLLKSLRHQVRDLGTHGEESVDYPDFAGAVGRAVKSGRAQRGILVCGTGIGMAIAANKIAGVRAAVAWNPQVARLASEHNNANVLCVSARFLTTPQIQSVIRAWLKASFLKGRHQRRVAKIKALETKRTKKK